MCLFHFNFIKKKRHNCYNCGLVFCHSCSSRVSPFPNGGSQSGVNISKSFNPMFGSSNKFFSTSVPGSRIVSRATSPISRRPSPPRSTTPTPTLGGLTSPKNVVDEARRTNESLSQEVTKLRAQVEILTQKAQFQESELERTTKQLKEAIAIAGEETAKEVIKSLTAQLKDVAERLPVGGTSIEQDEAGVYVTLMSLPGGGKDLKRVRFSRRRFSEKQVEQWWAENRARVYERYNVRMIDKSSTGVGSQDLAHY